jgi:transposase-like protein
MPSRKKINLPAILASLNLVCPKCQAEIEPAQIIRIKFEEINCPHCDSIVKPQRMPVPMPTHEVTCPYCEADLEIVSPLDHIFMARRTCPECGREFLIKDGKAVKSSNQFGLLSLLTVGG